MSLEDQFVDALRTLLNRKGVTASISADKAAVWFSPEKGEAETLVRALTAAAERAKQARTGLREVDVQGNGKLLIPGSITWVDAEAEAEFLSDLEAALAAPSVAVLKADVPADPYPCTVWSSRYAGWYAVPCEPAQVQPGFEGDAEEWWELLEAIRATDVPFGQGDSAGEATADLAAQVATNPDWFHYTKSRHPGIVYP